MNSDPSTILDALNNQPDEILIIQPRGKISASCLCDSAENIRREHPELAGSNVALKISDTGNLLAHIAALDGFAQRILFLPADLGESDSLEIAANGNNFDILIGDTNVQILSKVEPSRFTSPSQWLFLTSGTSGEPKLFPHTLNSLLYKIKTPTESADKLSWGLTYQPHRFAGMQVILQSLIGGGILVAPGECSLPEQIEFFAQNGVNALSATPSQWRKFLLHGAITRCPLKQITLGGEIADQVILSALSRTFPAARITHIYASTEAGVGFSVTDGKAGFPLSWLGEGPPIDMNISDTGTLMLRGSTISHSDLLHNRLTEAGYLDTQDCIHVVGQRVLFTGRASGIINVGGDKVHPEEVEAVVRQVPGVQDAMVSGKNNSIMGQLVFLEVQAGNLSQQQAETLKNRIRDHCRKHLPRHMLPAFIHVVDELAIADSGKIERRNRT